MNQLLLFRSPDFFNQNNRSRKSFLFRQRSLSFRWTVTLFNGVSGTAGAMGNGTRRSEDFSRLMTHWWWRGNREQDDLDVVQPLAGREGCREGTTQMKLLALEANHSVPMRRTVWRCRGICYMDSVRFNLLWNGRWLSQGCALFSHIFLTLSPLSSTSDQGKQTPRPPTHCR